MSTPIDSLITDRALSDVMAQNAKGTYSPSDWNRVGAAVEYLTDLLAEHGYFVATSPKTDWANTDFPTATQMSTYLADINAIRTALADLQYSDMPSGMADLSYKGANTLEQILIDVNALIDKINKIPCGVTQCGVVWDQLSGGDL